MTLTPRGKALITKAYFPLMVAIIGGTFDVKVSVLLAAGRTDLLRCPAPVRGYNNE